MCRNPDAPKAIHACIVEADESTGKRLEGTLHKDHEGNSLQHYNLVHKFIPMLQAMKILEAKAAVCKEWGKLDKIPAWQLTTVRNKKEVIDEARKEGETVHFASLMDICHLKNSELEPKFKKYKGRVVLRGDIVKDDSGSYAAFTEPGSSASQMTAEDKQRTQYQLTPRVVENSRVRMSKIFGYVYQNTNGQNRGPVWKTQSFLLNEIYTVIFQQDDCGGRQIEKVLFEHGWGKVPNWECLFVNREKGLLLSVCVDDIKIGWKETKS